MTVNDSYSLFNNAVFNRFSAILFLLLLIHQENHYRFSPMHIAENIAQIRSQIPPHVKIIAVSKTMPAAIVKEAYEAGQRAFGENKVQELSEKQPIMPKDTEWHLIGHLQTNKVKLVAPFVHLIHSVDSMKLLSAINLEASKINRTIDVLLQMRIATEETKFGLSFSEVKQLLNSDECKGFQHIRVKGLMGMATYTSNNKQVKSEFLQLTRYFEEIKTSWFSNDDYFKELSMGMSGDYQLAIEAGSTMVRIGSLIFGERNYSK
jgi:pyridoxal phosphate enzyme (YggS family)